MRKLLIGLVILLVLLLIALIAVPFFIPVETYKKQIAAAVQEATGRELSIGGHMRFALLPRLEIELNDVAFANPPGAATPHMATLKQLLVQLKLVPLLRGEVRVDSFVIVEPTIHLYVDATGVGNWQFPNLGTGTGGTGAGGGGTSGRGDGGGAPQLSDISLGDVRLTDASVTYHDARSGQTFEVTDINMRLSLPSLDSPFSADGSLTWNGQTIKLGAKTDKPRKLMAGGASPVTMKVESDLIKLAYTGTASPPTPLRVDGDVQLNVPSVRKLAAWVGTPIEGGGTGLGPLNISGTLAMTDEKIAFEQARIALDDMRATGDFAVHMGGKKPRLQGRLDVDRLNLNPYLPEESTQASSPQTAKQEPAAGEPADWSDAPLDLTGLGAVDADFALTVGAILVQKIKIGRSAMTIALKDSVLTADLSELQLYGGTGRARIVLDGRQPVATVQESISIEGIAAEPLLTDAADFDRLEGTGQMQFEVTTRGRTQRELIQALNGTGAVKFVDGAIKGINLGAMVRNVQSAFQDAEARKAQKTDFAELSGTFTIRDGIVQNDDLQMLNPLLRVVGAGTVNMPRRTLNYRITPKAVASTTGQGGGTDLAGIAVPVIISGPWHQLSYRPDLKGMIKETIADPERMVEGAKKTIEGIKQGTTKGLDETIGGLIGVITGQQPAAPAEEGTAPPTGESTEELPEELPEELQEEQPEERPKEILPDPAELLKGIFGN